MQTQEATAPPPGLWLTFRTRALQLGSMGRRLRLVTALAIAQVLAAAILLALRGAHVSTTPIVATSSGLASVPVPVLWLTVGFLVLAWTYLLAGASHGRPVIALIGLAAFGGALVPISQDIGWHGAPGLTRAVALAALALAVLGTARRRNAAQDTLGLDLLRLAIVGALVAIVYATFVWDAESHTVFRQFTFGIADQLLTLSFFLLPVLFLTGAEFAEWAEVVGERVSKLLDRIGSVVLVGAATVAISIAVLIHDISSYGSELPTQLGLFALAAAVIVLVGRRARPARGWGHIVPWAAMALTACAFIGILLTEVYRETNLPREHRSAADSTIGGRLHTYEHTLDPRFQLRAPENWEVLSLQPGGSGRQSTLIGFSGRSTGNPADFFVTSVPARLLTRGAQLLPVFLEHFYGKLGPHLGPGQQSGAWRRTAFTLGPRLEGVAWERRIRGIEWLTLGFANRSVFAANQKLFGFMWQSFTTHVRPLASPAPRQAQDPYRYNPVLIVPWVAWLVIAVLAGIALVALRSRAPPTLQAGLLFVLAFGVFYVLSEVRQVVEEVIDGSAGHFYSLRLPGIQASVAIATLAFIGVVLWRRRSNPARGGLGPRLASLLMLGAGLQLLLWIAQLYQTASSVGARFSIAQGIVILLALLWELAVSGEAITNGHSRLLPRASRVLAFCGYIMLVATAVLFFSSLRIQATGAAVEPQFESETWPALGILQLGVPALLCLAALRLGLFTRLESRQA